MYVPIYKGVYIRIDMFVSVCVYIYRCIIVYTYT